MDGPSVRGPSPRNTCWDVTTCASYDSLMVFITRFIRLTFPWLLAALLCGGWAYAQDNGTTTPPEATPSALRAQLALVPAALGEDGDIRKPSAAMYAIQTQAEALAADRKTRLAEIDARLAELGKAPEKGAGTEVADVVRQRASLQKERDTLDNELKLARLVAVDAQQRAKDLVAQRRTRFQAQLTERTDSPLGAAFWDNIRTAWPQDAVKLEALSDQSRIRNAANSGLTPALLWATVLGAMLVSVLGVWFTERTLVRLTPGKLPAGRLRRSMLAVGTVLAHVLIVGLASQASHWIVNRQNPLPANALAPDNLGHASVQFSMFAAFVVGLGRALLSNHRESWRLLPLTNATAARLRPLPWLTALVATLVWAMQRIGNAIEASLAADIMAHTIAAVALTGLVVVLLQRVRGPRTTTEPVSVALPADTAADAPVDTPTDPQAQRPPWLAPALGFGWLLVFSVWGLLATGYVALANFVAFQIVWTGIITATFYLLFQFTDDLCLTLLNARSNFGRRMQASFNMGPHPFNQLAVVLSGLLRVVLFFYMVIALLAPFGTSPGELFQRSGRFGTGIRVGEIQLVPQSLFTALGVAFAGFVALYFLKRWLSDKYLPSTTLEPGMRSSITTLLGYLGAILVVAVALSAVGISVERIAWVASALSVGIGFGLQAIVQNFISGLILLAERPVKVGDWVVLGATEGDVKRINVRATEIQLGDRSIVIVPNSELITKTVRNMTLTSAEGRVLIRLPMPLSTDASQVRNVIMDAFRAHPDVLETPAPGVQLDGIDGGYMVFQGTAYVRSPRMSGGVRSDLLFSILDGLKAADLPLAAYAFTVAAGDGRINAVVPKPVPPPAETA